MDSLLLYTVAISSLRVFYVDDQNIRPGRVRWSNVVYFSHIPSGVFTLLVFLVAIIVAWTLPLPTLAKIVTLAAFAIWTVWLALVLVLAKREFPLGNTRILTRSGRWISWVNFSLSLLSLVLITNQLRIPLGEDAVLPYLIGGLLLTIMLLTIRLIFTMAPSRLLSDLKNLRNDIIFLRADIDVGLRRYEVISEGETLPDALQKELSDVLRDVNVIAYAHSNMDTLIKKMFEEIPHPDDPQQKKEQKAKQIALDKDSYFLHEAKCSQIFASFETKLKHLAKKLQSVGAATGDWAGANTIRSSLAQQLELLERDDAQLKRRREAIDYYFE